TLRSSHLVRDAAAHALLEANRKTDGHPKWRVDFVLRPTAGVHRDGESCQSRVGPLLAPRVPARPLQLPVSEKCFFGFGRSNSRERMTGSDLPLARLGLRRLDAGRQSFGDVENSFRITHFHSSVSCELVRLSRGIQWNSADQACLNQIDRTSGQATRSLAVETHELLELRNILVGTQGAQMIDGVALDVFVSAGFVGRGP